MGACEAISAVKQMSAPSLSPITPELVPERTLPFEPLPQFRQNALEDSEERANSHGKRIGIFIVAYNALTTLDKVLKRITPQVWRNVEEVAVFDDASQDATYELAVGIQAMARIPKLRILKNEKNLGYGGNQKAGYRHFIESCFDIVVLLHGDGQYAPELLSHMYAPLVRGEADAVFGSRMMKDFGGPLKGGMPLYKYAGNRILTEFENRALGLNLTEFHSGYRAYNLHALSQISLDKLTDDFHFDTEIIIKLHHQNFRILEVPIPTFYGDEICYVNGMKYAKAILRAVQRYKETARSVRAFPEYEEYFVPYAVKRSLYSAHFYATQMVGQNQRVLEVTTGDSSFGADLANLGNVVTRVGPVPPKDGRHSGYKELVTTDLEEGLGRLTAESLAKFDRIVLLDVLEHLRDGSKLLEDCRRLLSEGGTIIISVPNSVNITVRLMILFGKLEYSNRGILDWTHLRFFTAKTIRKLLERHWFRITARKFTIIPIERVVPLDHESPTLRFGSRVLRILTACMPSLLAYEILLVAEGR
jgi:glycosyltransferase involved in cell wall biosynthesis